MSNIGCIMWGISLLLNMSVKYKRICEQPERKANTTYFGVYSIIVSIFTGALFVLSVWGIVAMVDGLDSAELGALLMWVFIAILVIVALFLFAEYLLGGLMGVIYQFRCNRKPISWIALVVFLITAVGMLIGILFVSNVLGIQ